VRRHQSYAATDNFGSGQLDVVETLSCSCSHILRRFSSNLVFKEVGVHFGMMHPDVLFQIAAVFSLYIKKKRLKKNPEFVGGIASQGVIRVP